MGFLGRGWRGLFCRKRRQDLLPSCSASHRQTDRFVKVHRLLLPSVPEPWGQSLPPSHRHSLNLFIQIKYEV